MLVSRRVQGRAISAHCETSSKPELTSACLTLSFPDQRSIEGLCIEAVMFTGNIALAATILLAIYVHWAVGIVALAVLAAIGLPVLGRWRRHP